MYKLHVTTSAQVIAVHSALAVHSVIVEFDTQDEADFAFQCFDGRPAIVAIKLYRTLN